MPDMSLQRKVTVAVLSRGRAVELERSLRRLTRLDERPAVVVVAAGDEAAAVAAGFPGVELARLPEGTLAARRNAAARMARTPFVAFCDEGAWWSSGSLSRAAELLEEHSRLAVVAARVLVGAERRDDPLSLQLALSPLPLDPGHPGRSVAGFRADASLLRRSAFLQAGGFDERFDPGGEEDLLAIDLLSAGWAIAYVADVVAHRDPARVPSGTQRRLLSRNALWLAWLRRPVKTAVLRTLGIVWRGLREPQVAGSLVDALAGLPWVLRERRPAPEQVEAALRLIETKEHQRIHA